MQSSAAAHIPGMNCNEMAGNRLTVCEQEQAFTRLVSISSNFLFYTFLFDVGAYVGNLDSLTDRWARSVVQSIAMAVQHIIM